MDKDVIKAARESIAETREISEELANQLEEEPKFGASWRQRIRKNYKKCGI